METKIMQHIKGKRKNKSELDILCDKRKYTIYVISEIHKQIKETQESMNFWIKRLDEEIEILENLNKKIERFYIINNKDGETYEVIKRVSKKIKLERGK